MFSNFDFFLVEKKKQNKFYKKKNNMLLIKICDRFRSADIKFRAVNNLRITKSGIKLIGH